MEFKPTHEKPLGKAGKAIEKDFTNQLGKGNINLTEIDSVLNEKEQSFKKKVWNLSKMESLVFSDPKLNAKYDDMSEDGQEKYGYHYNETIMNMLFNDYVTNDAGYRQKYLNAIPDEKERRDKSGINQLQQKGAEKMQKRSAAPKVRQEANVPIHNNSLSGVIEEDGMMDNNLNTDGGGTFDDREYLTHRINKKYDTMENTNEDIKGGITKQHDNFSNSDASITQANTAAMKDNDPLNVDDYDKKNKEYDTVDVDVDDKYEENPYNQMKETTGAASSGAFSTALGAKNNVYEAKSLDEDCGCDDCNDCNEKQIDETTTSSSSGSYEGPFRKKGKDHVTNKPAWKGGEIIGENYLVNTNMFKDIYNELNEGMDSPNDDSRVPMAEAGFDMTNDKQMQQMQLKNAYGQMDTLLKSIPTNPSARRAYEEIKKVAQNVSQQLGMKFNDPEKRGMFSKFKQKLGIGEGELNEDHLQSREEKINYILQNGNNKFGDVQMLNNQDDNTIDRIYQNVEQNQTAINPMGEDKNLTEDDTIKDSKTGESLSIGDIVQMDGIGQVFQVILDNERRPSIVQFDMENNKVIENGTKIRFIDAPYLANKLVKMDSYSNTDGGFQMGEGDVNEKSTSKSQQRFMGMVRATQKGELENPSASVEKVAKEMKPSDAEDFASTKHKGLPEKAPIDEDNENSEKAIKVLVDLGYSPKEAQSMVKTKLNSPEYKKTVDDIFNKFDDEYNGGMGQSEGMNEDLSQTVEYDSERSGEEPFMVGTEKWQYVNAIYPDGKKDIGVYRYGHDLVYSYDYFHDTVLGGRNDMGEGMISGTEGSIIGDNPTTIVNTMKDVQGSGDMGIDMNMSENGPEFDLNNHGRTDDVTFDNNNDMGEVGTSHGGLTGFNDRTDGYYPEYKQPEKTGAPQNKNLGKYNSMTVTEGKEQVCENCGEQLDEEGQCRRDEKPVAGKLSGEIGACEKKNKKSKIDKANDNKFNVKFRHKKEKERENKIEKKHTDYKKELEQNRKHMKKLKEMIEGTETLAEDKRPSALVQMDRLHKDNAKNFKSDVKNSNSAELAADQDELTAKEQIEEVPENAYELAEKIEKDKMKQHEFNSFDNDGNSTNDTNKDIPKRNATDEEADDIMLNRGLGMQDIVYDNKPDERFEKRMKKDMGEKIYDQRQEKMKFRADAPMYNKDTQPVEEDAVEKTQFDKNISKFNNPKGVKENHIVAGKFVNDMNKKEFVNFNVNEVEETKEPKGTKLVLEGMGNTYTQSVNENVDMRNMMDSWNFYINGGKITKVAKGKQTLTEGEEKPQINEQVQKMMKLAGYKPSDYVDTSTTRKNAKFKFAGRL